MYQCRLEALAAHRPCTPAVWRRVRVRACSHCDRSVSPRRRRSPRGGCPLAAQRHSDDDARVLLQVDSRGRRAAVAGHGLVIRHELASVAASGRIGRCSPGQPCAACPSAAARRTQLAEGTAARRALRGRAGDGPYQRATRRPRGHPVRRTAAARRARHPVIWPPCVDHPTFRHHAFTTFNSLFSLGRLGPRPFGRTTSRTAL